MLLSGLRPSGNIAQLRGIINVDLGTSQHLYIIAFNHRECALAKLLIASVWCWADYLPFRIVKAINSHLQSRTGGVLGAVPSAAV